MKKIFFSLLVLGSLSVFAQPKGKAAKMTPEFAPGYYVSLKGDTVRGEVQTNLDKEDMFYKSFFYRPKGGGKPAEITTKKAKAYGYGDTHFSTLKMDENDVYIRYVERGRLNLFEYKYAKVENGEETFPSTYFIIDTRATADDKTGTHELMQIPDRNHKKVLAKYFKDQPILLDQVDKWYFKIDEIRKAVSEFNAMYTN
jgi:hypothetical protein